jgi:hypothetical protein
MCLDEAPLSTTPGVASLPFTIDTLAYVTGEGKMCERATANGQFAYVCRRGLCVVGTGDDNIPPGKEGRKDVCFLVPFFVSLVVCRFLSFLFPFCFLL